MSLKDVLLLLCPCSGGSRGRVEGGGGRGGGGGGGGGAAGAPGGGVWGLQPPPPPPSLWEVFELVWSQLYDEVEGMLGERHFISQIP